ncbi:nectin-3 [Clarias gariepinus]|uniref:nectin-3 n=1 Tax=Clarias gariepinus TaxID=13013 RepID=UPI00234C3A93|nr:nectin-3 [Clarias gariepinus]
MYLRTHLQVIFVVILLWTKVRAIRIIGRDVTVTTGDNAQLFCQAVETSEQLTSITWQRRTKEKPTDTDFFAVTSTGKEEHINGLGDRVKFNGSISGLIGSILLSNVTVLDEGIYTCTVSVFPSGPDHTEIHLRVEVPPVVIVSTDVPPVAGDTEKILATCTAANSKPAAGVTWNLGALNDSVRVQTNKTVDSEGRYSVKSSLIGEASKDLNQKKVQCLVVHPSLKEELILDYTLNIHYPPQVAYIISAGVQGEFHCEADANPKPTNFTWSRLFPVKEPLFTGVNSNKLIVQLTPDSNGLYYCVVSNQHGAALGSLSVHVTPPTESKTGWTLLILVLIAGVCGFLIWKFNLHETILKRVRNFRRDPVPTGSSEE